MIFYYITFFILLTIFLQYQPSCGSYLGCYKDNTTKRDLPELLKIPDLTVDYCLWNCANLGYAYAGLQYSSECYCGNSYGKYGKTEEDECNYKCVGNSSQYCGGRAKNSIHIAPVFDSVVAASTPTSARIVSSMTPEWSILYPSSIFTTGKFELIRLFDILANSSSNLYAFANYYESQSKLDISTLVESVSNEANKHKKSLYTNKKTVYLNTSLNQGPSKTLIIAWSWPALVIFINCQLFARVNFTSANDLHVLSLPYYEKNSIRTIGVGIQPLESSIGQANCPKQILTTKTILQANFMPISTSLTTTSLTTTTSTTKLTTKTITTTTTASTTTKKSLLVSTSTGLKLEWTPTTPTYYYSQSDSISTIPTGNNIGLDGLDSNFILSIYNTRILQYQNLLKLQQIFQEYNSLNMNLYNLTFINCK